jgi:hypothetical protein
MAQEHLEDVPGLVGAAGDLPRPDVLEKLEEELFLRLAKRLDPAERDVPERPEALAHQRRLADAGGPAQK